MDSVPVLVRESLQRYAEHRVPVGGFLTAVLANDLFEACGRADEYNAPCLPAICVYIYNTLPAISWGSPEKVRAWLERREV